VSGQAAIAPVGVCVTCQHREIHPGKARCIVCLRHRQDTLLLALNDALDAHDTDRVAELKAAVSDVTTNSRADVIVIEHDGVRDVCQSHRSGAT
jgi:hypothetical protein